MSTKTIKPSAAERKIKRLQTQLATHKELHAAMKRQHLDYRANAGKLLAEHLATARRTEATLASNNMTIQELNDQVAMQWQQRAEARSDVERATKLTSEAVANHNRMVTSLRKALDDKLELVNMVSLLQSQAEKDWAALAKAKRTLSYRTWEVITSGAQRARAAAGRARARLRNRWLVWRLNKPRVDAMSEAGYIPEKLIKMAEQYWEQDKERAGGSIEMLTPSGGLTTVRQSPLRRLRIWLGRA